MDHTTFVLSRTPMRITLGGGGTDVLWYSKLRGGAWISGAVSTYAYVLLNSYYDKNLIKISDGIITQTVDNYQKIRNPIIRECLDLLRIKKGLEIISLSDVSPSSGLGGSGAFEVGLLNALHQYKGESVSQLQLAREACEVEIKRLKYPVGPQDQYITALGGISYFEIDTRGEVLVEPLKIAKDIVRNFEKNLLFFRTGIKKDTVKILGSEKKKIQKKDKHSKQLINALDEIKALGYQVKHDLLRGRINDVGASFDLHWKIKKRLSAKVSSTQIDLWYSEALKAGALGGKIMGAGGGGYFVFYVPKNKNKFLRRMTKIGLSEAFMPFDWEGSKVIYKHLR